MDFCGFFKKNGKVLAWVFGFGFVVGAGYLGYRELAPGRKIESLFAIAPDEVRGKIVILRKLKEEFFVDYHNMFSQDVLRNLEWPENIDLDYTIQVLRHDLVAFSKGNQLMYCIFDAKDNRLIGEINIRNMDSHGQFGCWINERYRGGGRIQEAVRLITDVFFRLTDEQSFIAHVRLWNQRSYKALLKAGFVDTKKFYYEDGKPTRYLLEFRRKK